MHFDNENPPGGRMYVATIYDTITNEHHPHYHQATIKACLRAANEITKSMNQKDFRVVLHGEWDARAMRHPFQPYLEEQWFHLDGTQDENTPRGEE